MNKFFTLLLLPVLLGSCRQAPAQRNTQPISPITLKEPPLMESNDWKGPFCAVSVPSHRIARTTDEWKDIWMKIGETPPGLPDFKDYFAVAVFLGMRNTGGYGVKWLEPEASGSVLTISYQEIKPRGLSMQVITQPYAVKLFSKASPETKIIIQARPS